MLPELASGPVIEPSTGGDEVRPDPRVRRWHREPQELDQGSGAQLAGWGAAPVVEEVHARILARGMITPVAHKKKHGTKHQTAPEQADAVAVHRRPLSELLRLPAGPVDLGSLATDATPGFPGNGKGDSASVDADLLPELDDLQERLFANGRARPPGRRACSSSCRAWTPPGRGGVIRHAIGMVDPQGVHIKAFKAPTKTELSHPFLWRIERELPGPGMIGIFDRSQYEDVLVVRVHDLVPEAEWGGRYDVINAWEEKLVAAGTTVVKCFLHVSHEAQKERLLARLDDPTKYWKYNPGDVDERALWPAYTQAYEAALERCSTQHAPVVRRPGRPQVVPELGRRPAARRGISAAST